MSGLFNIRALDGDPAHDGYAIRTIAGVPIWLPVHEVPPGGTTGQVLEKASGTDYDTTWATLVLSLTAGTNIWIDTSTDPAHPIVGALVPLTTVIGGVPDLVWDADDQLVFTEVH